MSEVNSITVKGTNYPIFSANDWRNSFRGKNLGTSFTQAQQTAIANGDFSDLWNGDYWTNGTYKFRIVDNTGVFYGTGDTRFYKNHLVIMPDENILSADGSSTHYWKSTDDTTGGYAGSDYIATYRAQALKILTDFFGADHIASHRELISNAISNGAASGWVWADCSCELPSEEQIFGTKIWGSSPYDVGINYSQFRLFQLAPRFIRNNPNYWLRNIVSSSWVAFVYSTGSATYRAASSPWIGVRPFALLI